MSLKNYSHEEIEGKSLVDLAKLILLDEKNAMNFNDIYNRVSELKELSDAEKEAKIGQFYTDLNMDGSFVTMGSNMWILKRFYRGKKSSDVEEDSMELDGSM